MMATKTRGPGRPRLPKSERAAQTLTVRLYAEDMATLRGFMSDGASASEVIRAGLRALKNEQKVSDDWAGSSAPRRGP